MTRSFIEPYVLRSHHWEYNNRGRLVRRVRTVDTKTAEKIKRQVIKNHHKSREKK
jgi:hypothetical protein